MSAQNSGADSQDRARELELLCSIARGFTELGDKLDDLSTLTQQQTDLVRRLLEKSERV